MGYEQNKSDRIETGKTMPLVKIERYKVFQQGDRGRAVRLPSVWQEDIEPGTDLDLFVDTDTGALVIPPPVKPPENGNPA